MATSPDPETLAALRREYGDAGLGLSDLEPDPLTMFERWLGDAVEAPLHEPNAMVVSTVSTAGQPTARLVLLKAVDERGLVFYTNYGSRKAAELAANPQVSLLFPWHDLQRQVRVDGRAEKVSREESAAYFASRPRESQLGAWASPQSSVVGSREDLDTLLHDAEDRFAGEDVPLPEEWGGFRVVPEAVEFWQGRKGRMHDRLVYRRSADGWEVVRLAP
jgi:pyridoxamine 5'-phosphate oxidase